jgi:hypothetical protein
MVAEESSFAMKKNVSRAVIEVGFIIFLFYSNLLMGEYERSGLGQRESSKSLKRGAQDHVHAPARLKTLWFPCSPPAPRLPAKRLARLSCRSTSKRLM